MVEGVVEGRRAVVGDKVHLHALDAAPPVVDAGVELHDLAAVLQQGQERQKAVAVEATHIEVVGGHVRGRHHHHAAVEQGGEQAVENQRIGRILDLELVEAQQPGLVGQIACHRRDGVAVAVRSGFAKFVEALVNLDHESVEMDPALAIHRGTVDEQVHDHGFAAADAAHQIETLGGLDLVATAEAEAGQKPGAPGRLIAAQPAVQQVKFFGGQFLGRIALDLAAPDQRPVDTQWVVAHGRAVVHSRYVSLPMAVLFRYDCLKLERYLGKVGYIEFQSATW